MGETVIFHSELALRVRAEIWHQLQVVLPYVGKHPEGQVGERKRERHILLGILAGISEHHALVSGALAVLAFPDHAPVDVTALLVYGREDSAGIAVEHVLGLVVAYPVHHAAYGLLDVDICVVAVDFTSDHHKTGGAEGLAGYLRLRILTEELVEHCVRNLVCHLVRMAFGHRLGSKEISGSDLV